MEVYMSILRSLKNVTFTDLPTRRDPVVSRRNQLAARLLEQKALFEDPTFVRVTKRFRGKGDQRKLVEITQRVSAWWRETANGGVVMSLKRGFQPIALDESGKTGIAVSSRDQFPALIDELRKAVLAGELDHALRAETTKRSKKQVLKSFTETTKEKAKGKAPAAA
jgi:hypothetical protein